MDAKEMKFQAQLEEYKQLKAEIVSTQRSSGTNRTLLILAYSAAIPLAFTFFNPTVLLGAAVIALLLWFIEIWRIITIHEIGTYIEVVLEKELDGLNWEHYFLKVRKGVYQFQFVVALLSLSLIVSSIAVSGWMLFSARTDMYPTYLLIWGAVSIALVIGSTIALVKQLRLSQRRDRTKKQMEKIQKGS